MNKSQSCGNCQWWTRVKSIKGLCNLWDLGWASSDHGKNCTGWKRVRDTKPRSKRISSEEYEG